MFTAINCEIYVYLYIILKSNKNLQKKMFHCLHIFISYSLKMRQQSHLYEHFTKIKIIRGVSRATPGRMI